MNNNFIIEKCPQCGANLKTGINGGTLFCNYCGFEKRIYSKEKEMKEDGNDSKLGKYEAIVGICALVASVLILFIIFNKL